MFLHGPMSDRASRQDAFEWRVGRESAAEGIAFVIHNLEQRPPRLSVPDVEASARGTGHHPASIGRIPLGNATPDIVDPPTAAAGPRGAEASTGEVVGFVADCVKPTCETNVPSGLTASTGLYGGS